MSVNRILKKRRQEASSYQNQTGNEEQRSGIPQLINQQPKMSQQQAKLQEQFQAYTEYSQSNPASYEFSNTHLPFNASLYSRFKLPISLFIPPVSYEMDPVQKSIDKIPRCGVCRAYMNYYNQIDKRDFICFVCGKQNMLGDYVIDPENIELCQPSYHVLGGENVYTKVPPENAMVFLVDLNVASFQSKMLFYFVAAAKEVLSREEFNQTQIYFFTYDEVIHEYDFSGDQVKCTVLDPTINNSEGKVQQNFLSNIREKLFNLLDSLEEISQHNRKQGSNFFHAFSYVFETVKNTGAKMFIFQSNEAISGESFANEYLKNPNMQTQNRPKSLLQTRNKTFFSSFVEPLNKLNMSFALFVFQKNYKNLRVFADIAKVTNSELFSYRKDSTQDLMKFYYDLSYTLGATYYSDVRMELVISPGWYFTAVYGNVFRIREHITFKICHLQPSKRVCVTFLPQQNVYLPYCAIQVISNYIYNRQHFVSVNTMVLPLTTNLQKLYTNQNYNQSAATLHKMYMSGLRLEEINLFRNKAIKQLAIVLKTVNQFYKKKLSPEINNLFLSVLGIMKSVHFQIQTINDSIVLDNVVCQRNFLQSCGVNELQSCFSPYLFNLTSMSEDMCIEGEDFAYPELCDLKFSSVQNGVFLLDNGLSLYLYFSKACDPIYLKMLFGKEKFSKGEELSEDMFLDNNLFAQQVGGLVRVCREQKSYGWVPLYIVRCGENSLNEKLFYMNFYAEKYDQFRAFKMTLSEFLTMLSQQY